MTARDRAVGDVMPRQVTRKREKPGALRMVDYVCKQCGVTFAARFQSLGRKYCSYTCAGLARRGKVFYDSTVQLKGETANCSICGKEYYRRRSTPNRTMCSRACWTEHLKANPRVGFIGSADNSGAKNGRYVHGKRVGTNISKKAVRTAVAARDGNWCLICGTPPPGLHLHRVRYGSEGGKYREDNCVQLCGHHHDVMHSDKHRFKPLLLAYVDACMSVEMLRREVQR